MLSSYDRWLTTPPDSKVPELDAEDEVRILSDILWKSYRDYHPTTTESAFLKWLNEVLFEDDAVFEALVDQHRDDLDERWAEEHSDPLDDGDAAYERSRDRQLDD